MSFSPRTRLFVVASLVVLTAVLAGCSKPAQESTSGIAPLDTRAPSVTVTMNHAWEHNAASSGALKIIRLNVTTSAATTMRWQDVRLRGSIGNFTASSAYVRLANGTSFGWSAPRTLVTHETLLAEIHFRTNGTIEEPTAGAIVGPGWTAEFSLPQPSSS